LQAAVAGGNAPPAENPRAAARGDGRLFAAINAYDDEDLEEEDTDPLAWIPKKVMAPWINEDGIRCISIVFQLCGGDVLTDNTDVEVHLSTLGDELAISEVWSPMMADVRNYYSTFPKLKSESDENAMRKRIAMCDACDNLAGGNTKISTYKMRLPFRVDSSVKTVRFVGTDDGQRYAAVDLAERSTSEVETFTLFTARAANNSAKKKKINNSGSIFSK
jgi:hypothetical protein